MASSKKKRGRKGKGDTSELSEDEPSSYFRANEEFEVTGVKQVHSTDSHQPPIKEESVSGRYAGVLFTSASRDGDLYRVYEDMEYLKRLY